MDAYRLNVKLDFAAEAAVDLGRLIPIFHRWIQEGRLAELWIDVADYRHVPDGPGVMLIAHEGHFGVEAVGGRLGLLYARKRPAGGGFPQRLRAALGKALAAGRCLEREAALEDLNLPGDRWTLSIQDRLLAPNDETTRRAVEPELRRLLDRLYPGGFELHRQDDAAECFALRVEAGEAPGINALRQRLAAA